MKEWEIKMEGAAKEEDANKKIIVLSYYFYTEPYGTRNFGGGGNGWKFSIMFHFRKFTIFLKFQLEYDFLLYCFT